MQPEKGKVKDEVAALLPEVEIGPYQIKPWSFGRFKKVYPALIGIIPVLKGLDMTPDNAQEVLLDKGAEIIEGILPVMSGLIAATLDIPETAVDDMAFDQAAAIGLTIVSQNIERIKNSLPLIMGQFKAMVRAT
jgi:predicted ribosome-associated RNA-binding protein Tma20